MSMQWVVALIPQIFPWERSKELDQPQLRIQLASHAAQLAFPEDRGGLSPYAWNARLRRCYVECEPFFLRRWWRPNLLHCWMNWCRLLACLLIIQLLAELYNFGYWSMVLTWDSLRSFRWSKAQRLLEPGLCSELGPLRSLASADFVALFNNCNSYNLK